VLVKDHGQEEVLPWFSLPACSSQAIWLYVGAAESLCGHVIDMMCVNPVCDSTAASFPAVLASMDVKSRAYMEYV
jgi:hypothetical protein